MIFFFFFEHGKEAPVERWPPAKVAGRGENLTRRSQTEQHVAAGNFPAFIHTKAFHLEVHRGLEQMPRCSHVHNELLEIC